MNLRTVPEIEIIKIKFLYYHDRCTFNFIDNEMNVKLVWSMLFRRNKMITYENIFPVNSKQMAKGIINKVRMNPTTVSIFQRVLIGKTLTLGYLERASNSPFFLSNKIGTIYYEECTTNGSDLITMFTSKDNFGFIRDTLSNYGELKNVTTIKVDMGKIKNQLRLTEMQELVLKEALELGYFDYPKKAHLKDLADTLGTSVVSIDQHLRESQRKIAINYFNT